MRADGSDLLFRPLKIFGDQAAGRTDSHAFSAGLTPRFYDGQATERTDDGIETAKSEVDSIGTLDLATSPNALSTKDTPIGIAAKEGVALINGKFPRPLAEAPRSQANSQVSGSLLPLTMAMLDATGTIRGVRGHEQ